MIQELTALMEHNTQIAVKKYGIKEAAFYWLEFVDVMTKPECV